MAATVLQYPNLLLIQNALLVVILYFVNLGQSDTLSKMITLALTNLRVFRCKLFKIIQKSLIYLTLETPLRNLKQKSFFHLKVNFNDPWRQRFVKLWRLSFTNKKKLIQNTRKYIQQVHTAKTGARGQKMFAVLCKSRGFS